MFENAKFIYQNSLGKTIEFSLNSPFKLYKDGVTGLSQNSVKIDETSIENQVGTVVESQTINSKDIVLEGEYSEDIVENRRKIINTFFPNDTAKFYYYNYDEIWYLDVIPITTPTLTNDEDEQRFQITLKVPYPFWKSKNDHKKISFGTFTSKYKYPQSFSNVIKWKISDKTESTVANIYNDSPYSVGINVTFKCNGNVQNPYIINVRTQEKIELQTTYPFLMKNDTTGYIFKVCTIDNKIDVIVIEENGYAYSNINMVTFESTFLKLSQGDNVIRFGAAGGEESLEAIIEYESIQVGI